MNRKSIGPATLALALAALLLSSPAHLFPVGAAPAQQTLTVIDVEPVSLDPSVEITGAIIEIRFAYESLLHMNPDGKLEPRLAVSRRVSPDGKTWTIELRRRVKFHDGTAFNAEAAKFSIERTMRLKRGPSFIWDAVDRITARGEYTLEITTKQPVPLDKVLAATYGSYMISPTAVRQHEVNGDLAVNWLKDHTAGTGPYRLGSWRHNQELVFTRFPDYWRGWGGQHVDRVVVKVVSEYSTKVLMLKTGRADLMDRLAPEAFEAFRADPNLQVHVAPTLDVRHIFFNMAKAPTDNVKVRQAISYAFDYEQNLRFIFTGGTLPRSSIPKGLWAHDESAYPYRRDVQTAKRLLAEAGHPNGGLTVTFALFIGDEQLRRTVELLKANLAEIGITLETQGMGFSTIVAIFQKADTALHMTVKSSRIFYADPYPYLRPLYHSDQIGTNNWSFYRNARIDALIEESYATSATQPDEAAKSYKEIQRILAQDVPAIPFIQYAWSFGYRSAVKGFQYNPYYALAYDVYAMYKE